MDTIQRFSDTVIDLAERLSNVADAAAGNPATKGRNGAAGTTTRWLLLPAAGAALYAFAKSDFVTRQARGVVDEAKTRASDLPNDLMKRIREMEDSTSQRSSTSQRASTKSGTRGGSQRSASQGNGSKRSGSQRSPSQRRRRTSSSRNSKAG